MHNKEFFLRYRLHHLFFWMLVLGLWYYLRYDDYSSEKVAFQVTLIKVTDLALMVYITNYLLIPHLLYKKRYFFFAFLFLAMIVSSSILKMQVIGTLINNPLLLNFNANLKDRIYDNVLPHIFLVIAGGASRLLIDQVNLQRKMTEMAKEKAEAELSFLKSQINPHFLFNTLNAVYFLIDKENTPARNTLHKFSEMLRYQLYEASGDHIPIEKEIAYLKDYVELQKLRKDENYSVEMYCGPELKEFKIAPLLLIIFVENAFKHLSHYSSKKNYIKIELSLNNGVFHFHIENSREEPAPIENQGGIGLKNVKRRLELLYPGLYNLSFKINSDLYVVHLSLNLKK